MVPPPIQTSVGIIHQITYLILHYISSRLSVLLKVVDALFTSDIFYFTLCFKLILAF